jgi:subtilisin-like proprotein convertase family protein
MRITILSVLAILLFSGSTMAQKLWQHVSLDAVQLPANIDRDFEPTAYQAFSAEYEQLKSAFYPAPMENSPESAKPTIVALPTIDGGTELYAFVQVQLLSTDVAARYPDIRTYAGYAVAEPARKVRVTLSPDFGFRAMIRRADKGIEYIEPLAPGQKTYYRVYDRLAFPVSLRTTELKRVLDIDLDALAPRAVATQQVPAQARGELKPVTLKVFRFACATTGEFSQDHGGTTASVLATMTDYTNRLNAIYEADLAVRLVLVDGIERILFLDPATDPYTSISVRTWADQNPSAMLAALGAADRYDIGHLFARFLGGDAQGVAGGAVCTQFKGRACSAGIRGMYGDDFFGVVGQEIGHQWSAGHTWANCGDNGQISPLSACEPGSGSTIMSYGGICGPDNVQNGADLYYNICSIIQIRRFIDSGIGTTCGSVQATNNNTPVISLSYPQNFSIPISTPFELVGSATDPDGDQLTYCWEQVNPLGFIPLGTARANSPLFRSFPPTRATNRVFPRIESIIANRNERTEVLPNYSRDISMGLTVRDNRAGGGGVSFDTVAFRVTATAGPFLVSSPNTAVTWEAGRFEVITWDVANTDKVPVNCRRVNLRMSTDGGLTYPITLASGVPNNGRACVSVPNAVTTRARVRVEAADNIFFDISNVDFTVRAASAAGFALCAAELVGQGCAPAEYTVSVSTAGIQSFNTPINLRAVNLPAGATATFSPNPVQPGSASTMTVRFTPTTPEGQVEVRVEGTAGTVTSSVSTLLTVVQNNLSALALRSPADATSGISTDNPITLRWQAVTDADAYDVQVATNPSFDAASLRGTNSDVRADSVRTTFTLAKGTVYYWRVRGKNACGNGSWVGPFAFVTGSDVCATYASTDLPKNITANSAIIVESQINVPSGGAITDVNVLEVRGRHDFLSDLEVRLIPPSGGNGVLLFRNSCTSFNGNFNFGFDDAAAGALRCPPSATNAVSRPAESLTAFRGITAAGTWTLRVNDTRVSSGGQLAGFRLELCAAGAAGSPPVIVINNILNITANANAQVNAALLKAEDPNTGVDKLVFTLMTLPQFGRLELNGQPLALGGQFTQVDLNNGAIRFFDNGQNRGGQDGFRFAVTDGEGGLATGTFLIRQPTSTRETLPSIDFNVSPNPAVDRLRLSFGEALRSNTRVMLFDATGRQVRSWNIAAKTPVLDAEVQGLPAGAYMLSVSNAEGFGSKMIIVQSK